MPQSSLIDSVWRLNLDGKAATLIRAHTLQRSKKRQQIPLCREFSSRNRLANPALRRDGGELRLPADPIARHA